MTNQAPFGGKRTFIYARASTAAQKLSDRSIAMQIAAAERWIDEHGAQAMHTFSETGSAIDNQRPVLRDMIERTETNENRIDILLVDSLSRLSCNPLNLQALRERLRRRDIQIVSVLENMSDDTTLIHR